MNSHGTADSPARRILIVEISHDGTVGGSHQALYDLARHLDPTRYTPIALFYKDNPFAQRLRTLGFKVVTWDVQFEREHGTRGRWFHPSRTVRMVEAIARRVALLRRERIDLLHINNNPSYSYFDWLPAARICGIPCVTHLRGELYPIRNKLGRWLNSRFDGYIAISTYVRDILEKAGVAGERIYQIEDGIDIENVTSGVRRSRSEVRAEIGVPSGALLAVMVGNLWEWKGQDVVLHALGGLEPILRSRLHVAFAGADDPRDTRFRRRLDDLVRTYRLDSNVCFLGARNDVPDLMSAADVVLHASTSPEPFGLVVVEAMALGKLVIASALGGPLQIVSEGSGWTFDPAYPTQLTELLHRVIDNPALCSAQATAAVARANQFTVQRTITRVQHVYDGLLRYSVV